MRIGKIENVDIRTLWPNEEHDFTPWLKDNISYLTDLIGTDIQDLENEESVGSYSADLVGKISGSNDEVVIENQFGQTDHDHLGKLLTYLSGKGAKIGIWIAEDFKEEHIAALEYLNDNTKHEGLSLFGIKIEVKKIGNSEPAPDFSIIVKPNEYKREISQEILSEADKRRNQLRLEFFTKLADRYKQLNPNWHKVKASENHWLSFGAGRTGFSYAWVFKSFGGEGTRFALELHIDQHDKEENKRIFDIGT